MTVSFSSRFSSKVRLCCLSNPTLNTVLPLSTGPGAVVRHVAATARFSRKVEAAYHATPAAHPPHLLRRTSERPGDERRHVLLQQRDLARHPDWLNTCYLMRMFDVTWTKKVPSTLYSYIREQKHDTGKQVPMYRMYICAKPDNAQHTKFCYDTINTINTAVRYK